MDVLLSNEAFHRSLENIVIFRLTASGSLELNLHQQHPYKFVF
jgi:hypothetical protein